MHAPLDGYTLLLIAPNNAINASLYEKLNHNFLRDIAPVAGINRFPNVMEVNPSVPVKTVPEFVAYAKANPGKRCPANPRREPNGNDCIFDGARCGQRRYDHV